MFDLIAVVITDHKTVPFFVTAEFWGTVTGLTVLYAFITQVLGGRKARQLAYDVEVIAKSKKEEAAILQTQMVNTLDEGQKNILKEVLNVKSGNTTIKRRQSTHEKVDEKTFKGIHDTLKHHGELLETHGELIQTAANNSAAAAKDSRDTKDFVMGFGKEKKSNHTPSSNGPVESGPEIP